MANDLLVAIQEEGARKYPNEACGLVIRKGKKSVAIPCRNMSDNPRLHFLMNVDDYAAAADQGEVIGVWHTHVDIPPTPSVADKVGCENSEMPWYIVAITKSGDEFLYSEMVTVEPNGFEIGYLERPYAFGVLDCWSLVRDFYRREYQLALSDYPRIERFWENGHNFFGENWKKEGFVRLLNGEQPMKGDLFLIQTDNSGNPNHIAIYVGNEMILHHCHGRLSRRDIYGGYWHKHTTHHLRHETKC